MSSAVEREKLLEFSLENLGGTPDYLAYVQCFKDGRYYDAHDALEPLWLQVRTWPEGNYLKALIQLAGAFVHVQKRRTGPARALLERARFHLEPYLALTKPVNVVKVLALIECWAERLVHGTAGDDLFRHYAPPEFPLDQE